METKMGLCYFQYSPSNAKMVFSMILYTLVFLSECWHWIELYIFQEKLDLFSIYKLKWNDLTTGLWMGRSVESSSQNKINSYIVIP